MTTVIRGTDDSASTPALTGTDADTGIFFPAANTMAMSTGGTERVRVNSSGNVGIGTSSPPSGSRLAVVGGGIQLSGGTTSQEGIRIQRASGYASISGINNDNNAYNPIAFFTSGTEAARIDSSGNLLVGTTSITGVGASLSPGGRLQVGRSNADAVAEFYFSGTRVGQINITNTATSYITSSDYRLKENVQPMTGALAKVAALKPCTYTWKSTGEDSQGFIAHELQEVVPDCVSGEKDAVNEDGSIKPQGIDTSFLVATLTAAIQEQQQMIETLQAKVAALEAKG